MERRFQCTYRYISIELRGATFYLRIKAATSCVTVGERSACDVEFKPHS